jgi:hypothetical protein
MPLLVSCSYFTKYGPYKAIFVSLARTYQVALKEVEKVNSPGKMAELLDTITLVHVKSRPKIDKIEDANPELRQKDNLPQEVTDAIKEYWQEADKFNAIMNEKLILFKRNNEVEKSYNEYLESLREWE